MSRLQTNRIYDPQTSNEGTRVLVMRLWPRGIKKSRIDRWLKELGPEYPTLKSFKSGRISWAEFTRQYKTGLKKSESQAQLKTLKDFVRQGPVTIFCSCVDE